MKSPRIPDTDSIDELARFWDSHDVTDFENQLEEIRTPVFVRRKVATLEVALTHRDAQALKRVARSQGRQEGVLVREWVREKVRAILSNKPPNKRMEPTRSGSRKRAAHS